GSRYVLVGDSHAAAIRPAVEVVPKLQGMRGELWWRGACALMVGVKTVPDADSSDCVAFRERAIRELEQRTDITTVVLAGRWSSYLFGRNPEVGGTFRTFLVDMKEVESPSPESTVRLFRQAMQLTV